MCTNASELDLLILSSSSIEIIIADLLSVRSVAGKEAAVDMLRAGKKAAVAEAVTQHGFLKTISDYCCSSS